MEECYFVKVEHLHGCFLCFLNYTDGTKSRKATHMHRLSEKISF